MIAKTIEIRDAMTFIPALAVKLEPSNPADEYLLARQGYERRHQGQYVLLVWFARAKAEYDPNAWGGRTLPIAHKYVIEHFDELVSGAVVDVEYLMGLTTKEKMPERLTHPV